MSDLVPNPKPLPLRVPPADGEAWPGYLTRLAHEYRCREAHLVLPISRHWAQRLTFPAPSTTCYGIAMTAPVAEATARRMNLSPAEIQAMQLSTHDGVTVSFDDTTIEKFDPVVGAAIRPDFTHLGWLSYKGIRRWCRRCEQDGWAVAPLMWHYPWATMCQFHGEPLRRERLSTNWEAWADGLSAIDVKTMVTAQAKLEDIVSSKGAFRRHSALDGFLELRVATEALATQQTDWHRPDLGNHEWIPRVLPDALDAIETHSGASSDALEQLIGDPHESLLLVRILQRHGVTSPFGLRHELSARYGGNPAHGLMTPDTQIHVPVDQCPPVAESVRVHTINFIRDRGLPHNLVIPTLSDYAPWLSLSSSHVAASQTAYMMLARRSLRETCRRFHPWNREQGPLRRLWWHLESTGQFDQYFSDVRAALLVLVHERPWEAERPLYGCGRKLRDAPPA